MKLFYQNNKGDIVDFNKSPIYFKRWDLSGYRHGYDVMNGVVGNFKKQVSDGKIDIVIRTTKDKAVAELNRMFDVFEYDISINEAGKLYYNDQYLKCWICGSTKNIFKDINNALTNTLKVLMNEQTWVREVAFDFPKTDATGSAEFLDFPHDYPHDYSMGDSIKILNNAHFGDCDFKMNIYGSCINPSITIGGNLYEVQTTLREGEYLHIDSKLGEVYTVQTDGTIRNEFNNKKRGCQLFKKISSGSNAVNWNGQFGFDIVIYQERSEPEWSL